MKKELDSKYYTLHKYLINQSQSGDRKAQNELYKLYAKSMYGVCRRIMGNDEDAKDVLQDSFIYAFKKINTLKDETLFTAWLKKLVINHSINALKKRQKGFIYDQDIVKETGNDIIEEEFDYKQEYISEIKQVLDLLSVGCRTVLNLYAFEGYDHKEIAQILSISESASKAQYSKAKSKIRELIAQ